MKITGIDPSLANFGIAQVVYEEEGVFVTNLRVVRSKKKGKGGHDYMRRARKINEEFSNAIEGSQVVIAEIPNGSQSSSAAWSLGIVLGILSSCPIPLIEVSNFDVKRIATGKKSASKEEVMEWALDLYPDAPWLKYRGRLTRANEHLADALAVIHAGINTKEFHELQRSLNGHNS